MPEAARSTSWGSARFATDFEGPAEQGGINVLLHTTSETFHTSFLHFALTVANLDSISLYDMLLNMR